MNGEGSLTDSNKREETIKIIKSAQGGCQSAFESLKETYKPLIESCVARHSAQDMPTQDVEDMRQEALFFFFNAVSSYDTESDGVEFGLYAKICIENGLVSFIRKYMRRIREQALSFEDNGTKEALALDSDLLQNIVDVEREAELVRVIRNSLSDFENKVWWLYVSGMAVSEIAAALKLSSAKSVSNAIYRIRKKLRDCIKKPN